MKAFAIGAWVKIERTGQIGSVESFFYADGGWRYTIRFGDEPNGAAYRVYGRDEIEEARDAPRHRRITVL